MSSYISEIESRFKSGDLSVRNYSVESIKDLTAHEAIMDSIYNQDNTETRTLADKSIENMSMAEIEKEKNRIITNLSAHTQEALNYLYRQLIDGEIDKVTYEAALLALLEVDREISNNTGRDKEALIKGEVLYEGNSSGQHQITRGVEANLEEMGINAYKLPYGEHEINYTVEDGNFIIFKDDPNLYYYTQSAKQGTFNYYVAGLTKTYGELFQTYYTKRILDKTPKVSEKIDKALDYININDPNAREFGKYFGSWWAKDNIPIVKDINIIGVDIPEIGTEEVILYISEDGKNWDKGVRFIVKEGEEPQFKKIEPNRW